MGHSPTGFSLFRAKIPIWCKGLVLSRIWIRGWATDRCACFQRRRCREKRARLRSILPAFCAKDWLEISNIFLNLCYNGRKENRLRGTIPQRAAQSPCIQGPEYAANTIRRSVPMDRQDQFSAEEVKYLKLLSKRFPTIQTVSSEIINLRAILDPPQREPSIL